MNSKNLKKFEAASQNRSILETVIERCKKEKERNKLEVPLEDFLGRASFYTGLPISLITNISSVNEVELSLKSTIAKRDLYNRCLKNGYQKGKCSPVDVFNDIKTALNIDYTQFRYELLKMGYLCKKTTEDSYIVIEDPKQRFDRYLYLKKIKMHRENKNNIYYIDERIIFSPVAEYLNQRINSKNENHASLILLQVISSKGLHHYLCCDETNADEYLKWLKDLVIPKLQPSSLIVLHESPLHKMEHDSISRFSKKTDMMKWLRTHNISNNDSMHTSELYELIDKCSAKTNNNMVERFLKANGFDVIYLPKNYVGLSLSEHMWENIAVNVTKNLKLKTKDKITTKNVIIELITSIANYRWSEFDAMLQKIEENVSTSDLQIDNVIDNISFIDDDDGACKYFVDITSEDTKVIK